MPRPGKSCSHFMKSDGERRSDKGAAVCLTPAFHGRPPEAVQCCGDIMSDPWELLLHHSYAGTPGVIFDDSPKRRNHGRGRGLVPDDYLASGASPRSGAVSFRPGCIVDVLPLEPWDPIPVLRAEIVCRWEEQINGTLFDAGVYSFGIRHEALRFDVKVEGGSIGHSMTEPDPGNKPAIPFRQWMTLGVFFDFITGFAGFTIDGQEVDRVDASWAPSLMGTDRIGIGNSMSDLSQNFRGAIDDIKIWRLDPNWVDKTFTHRPVDPRVRDCWDKWSDGLGKALNDDVECAQRVANLIRAAVNSLIRRASRSANRGRWEAAVADYRMHWEGGDLSGVADVLNSVIAEIGADLQLTTDPAIAELINDPCVQRLIGKVPSLDCDPQFTGIFSKTSQVIS